MTQFTEQQIAEIAGKLSETQRHAVLSCQRRVTGPDGEVWRFRLLNDRTRNALARLGVAEKWGVVSADLTPFGIAVRAHLERQQ